MDVTIFILAFIIEFIDSIECNYTTNLIKAHSIYYFDVTYIIHNNEKNNETQYIEWQTTKKCCTQEQSYKKVSLIHTNRINATIK